MGLGAIIDTESVSNEAKPAITPDSSNVTLYAIIAGTVGAIIGAGAWFLVAKLFYIQIGYLAIAIGFIVGFAMKYFLKGKKSVVLGLIAVFLTLFGMFLGKYFIWYFAMPDFERKSAADEIGISVEEMTGMLDGLGIEISD